MMKNFWKIFLKRPLQKKEGVGSFQNGGKKFLEKISHA
uniref:Uncharacterized protein n=1 Tax=Myoviridae sp. ctPuP5 TaxID=2823543 RepID=A0A8S5L9H3_9CAUD|nr:MAG TPA: hypothetical protein [Myoviridae sp. ctPuP5]